MVPKPKKSLKMAIFNEYLTVIKSKLNVLCMIHNTENKMETLTSHIETCLIICKIKF